MFCTECGKEIKSDFKFCPYCGHDMREIFLPPKEALVETGQAVSMDETLNLSQQFGSVETSSNIYRNSKLKLLEIGKRRGYIPSREYFFQSEGQWRKASIIWGSPKGGIAAAFDVKSTTGNLEDIDSLERMTKLVDLSAEKKYVVNVSKMTGKAHFIEVTEETLLYYKAKGPTIQPKSFTFEQVRQYHKNAFRRWDEIEEVELKDEFNQGLTIEQIAQKHQRGNGGIFSRLIKLDLISETAVLDPKLSKSTALKNTSLEDSTKPISPFTLLVKSQKNHKLCLAFVDNNNTNRWIRPIRAGGFDEQDIVLDNGKPMEIFDVVDLDVKIGMLPSPIDRYKENIKYTTGASAKFVRKLNNIEKELLLSRIANKNLLTQVLSKDQLRDVMNRELNQSLILVGPLTQFGIELKRGENHPRIWIIRDNNYIFSLPCTDIQFCNFINSKIPIDSPNYNTLIDSNKFPELQNKQIYLVLGMTGDSLDENEQVIDGKWHDKYWPLTVSVISIPQYLERS